MLHELVSNARNQLVQLCCSKSSCIIWQVLVYLLWHQVTHISHRQDKNTRADGERSGEMCNEADCAGGHEIEISCMHGDDVPPYSPACTSARRGYLSLWNPLNAINTCLITGQRCYICCNKMPMSSSSSLSWRWAKQTSALPAATTITRVQKPPGCRIRHAGKV